MLKKLEKFSLPEIEEKVLKFWQENKIFDKSLQKNAPASAKASARRNKTFVFYEGPPTANGRPGIHHVLARAFKDIIPRYKTMRGFHVPRQGGWDTHGLPVEIEVEKALGLKSKKEIEKYGIAAFNAKCKESVWKYKDEWEKLTERMGFWLDLKNPYITYENSYIEKLWGIIKKIADKKLLYRGYKVVPWCTRCGTALSSHEMAQGYQEVQDQSVYVKFRLAGKSNRADRTYILSWTTTPWTLPGNVALAINPKIAYVKIKAGKEFYILAKERLSVISEPHEVVEEMKGKDLIGLKYEPLFEIGKFKSDKPHRIYPANFVTTEEGTGVVHTAVMYGEDDYELGKKIGLPQHHTVDEQGKFTKDVPELAGFYVKDKKTEEKIFQHLKTHNSLLKTEIYIHEYPFCWRCSTPLLYYARSSWFVAMSKLRKKLLAENEKISWIPGHLKRGRFGEWLKEVKDWNFSRERYWGTPLPVWQCEKCESMKIVGSVKELGGDLPKNESGEVDLHRPYVDKVVLECPKCRGEMKRVKELADVWFDSGSMPFATNSDYPADYISEGVDQTRGWFYTLHAIGTLMGKGRAYKNVISVGLVLDKNGQKMSKSRGNVVDPWAMIDKYGIDAVRWYLYTVNPPGEPKRFDEQDLAKTLRQFILLIYNSFVFYETYAVKNSKFEIRNSKLSNVLDQWILARLNETVAEATKDFDKYDIGGAAKAISALVDDLSRWYIRRSRRRFQKPEDQKDYRAASQTLGYVLQILSKLLAPFTPFFAEALFKSLQTTNHKLQTSVHLEDWPTVNQKSKIKNQSLLKGMEEIRRLASLVLAKRAEAGIKVRQPLAAIKIRNPKSEVLKNKELIEILKDEINVKEIIFDKKIKEEIWLDTNITHELKEEGWLREMARLVQGLRQDAGFQPQDKVVLVLELPAELNYVIHKSEKILKNEVSAKIVEYKRSEKFDIELETKLDEWPVWVGLRKLV